MRLIDADEFKKQIAGMAIANNYAANKANKMCELIEQQPTAYDVDKVIDRINTIFKHHTATKIVQRLVVETIEVGVCS